VRTAGARAEVMLEPVAALALWADTGRWAGFVEGFAHVESVDAAWPQEGSRVIWKSTPDGRGRVTEKVLEKGEARLVTQVFEEALTGTQTFAAHAGPPGGSVVEVLLDYELARRGPLRGISDVLFIRRALRDALRRTTFRFAVEAEEEAGLR